MASNRDLKFLGWRRENGRVGIRNHVVVLPLDDISNAALRSGRPQHQGHHGAAAPIWAAAVRRRSGAPFPDADRHRRQSERRRRRGSSASSPAGPAGWSTAIAKTGKPVVGFSIEQNGDHQHDRRRGRARPRSSCSGPPSSSAWSAASRICGYRPSAGSPIHDGARLLPGGREHCTTS